ncbi:WUSCHEL-related homeobox 9-like [Wolffia australiana]
MASSNRHWPSLFKSKPCSPHLQWPHDLSSSSLLSSAYQKTPYASMPGYEERSPDPKPRWNPKPEQIRILEAIFNSGMVNPPREEIRKIRAQLQEYGQVGDANVFYWFQNRKSRSKHKQRHLQATRPQSRFPAATPATSPSAGSSSSSSSSERSSGSDKAPTSAKTDPSISPAVPAKQSCLYEEPFFFHGLPEYCISAADFACLVGVPEGLCHELLRDLITHDKCIKKADEETTVKMQLQHSYALAGAAEASSLCAAKIASASESTPTADIISDVIHGFGACRPRSTVFINGVAFDVGTGLVNLREAFGENAVLLNSSGHPVLIDDWGVTLHPLQHGASYFLI